MSIKKLIDKICAVGHIDTLACQY